MTYNRRDLIGHWVTKQTRTQQMCQHACCRGYRVHPNNYPVILPNPLLRRASEDDLAWHYEHAGSEKAKAQVLHELDRRDQADKRKVERKREHQARVFARRMERHEEVDRIYNEAEAATNGYMLNAAGREKARRGELDERDLFTGPESRVRRYGSDELQNYFAEHPRPTGAYFRGQRTTLGPMYSAPRKRHRVA
jgi:hypothetical protein